MLFLGHPITGRTHQLRVHLKSIGNPIINDRNYGGPFIGNKIEELLRKGKSIYAENLSFDFVGGKLLLKNKNEEKNSKETVENKEKSTAADDVEKLNSPMNEEEIKNEKKGSSNKMEKIENTDEKSEAAFDEEGESGYIREIWLHSLLYKYKDKIFQSKLPYFADQSYKF